MYDLLSFTFFSFYFSDLDLLDADEVSSTVSGLDYSGETDSTNDILPLQDSYLCMNQYGMGLDDYGQLNDSFISATSTTGNKIKIQKTKNMNSTQQNNMQYANKQPAIHHMAPNLICQDLQFNTEQTSLQKFAAKGRMPLSYSNIAASLVTCDGIFQQICFYSFFFFFDLIC